jgi:hypothetical protein
MVKSMKKKLSLISVTIFILSLSSTAFAQTQTTNPPPAQPVPQTGTSTINQSGIQQTAKSNNLCVKVGEPATAKPASCNEATPLLSSGPHPQAPPVDGDLQIEIQRQFGISMIGGYDQQHMQWAWEKFWEVSNTNFNSLVRGSIIQVTSVSNTHQSACPNPNSPSVYIGQFPEETAFKHILMHELGHVIRNCSGRERAQESAFIQAHKAEGGVSYYAKNAPACTGSDNTSEDYAEMIAFYLNNGTPVASYLRCYQQQQFRLSPQEYPLHFKVAQDVLGAY